MKIKTIDRIITKKFNEFLDSIKDDKVRQLVKHNSIITGGCIASMLLNEHVNDYDLYFQTKQTAIAVANYYINLVNKLTDEKGEVSVEDNRVQLIFPNRFYKEKGLENEEMHELGDVIEMKEDKGEAYRPLFMSNNAITLSSNVQLILRFYGSAEEIHKNYDFIHCTNYWESKEEKLVINQKALESIIAMELNYVGSLYPLASIIRIRKFLRRGWTINAGQIIKMAYQVSLLDLNDVEVLKDQLIGVDLAYFAELIDSINSIPENTQLNYGYLAKIIDKIF